MSYEKLALVIDTNILTNAKNDFSCLSLDLYYAAEEMIEINDLTENVNIYIPEIVLLEVSNHHLLKIKKSINQLDHINSEFKNVNEIEVYGYKEFDVEAHVNRIKSSTLKQINLIKIPSDHSNLFKKILKMALQKIPPFEVEKSDKGFKDAIIFLSLVEFAKREDYTKFVLFSKDKAFKKHEKELSELFNQETSKKFEIMESNKITNYISNEYGLFLDLKKYLNNEFYVDLDDEIKMKEKIYLEESNSVYSIKDLEIDTENTTIIQLNDNEYDLSVAFALFYIDDDEKIKEIDDFICLCTFENNDGYWKLTEKKFNYKVF